VDGQRTLREMSPANMAKGGHNNKVCAIKTLPDYNTFVSCGWDQNLIIWDIRKKEPIDQTLAEKVAGDAIDIKSNQLLMGYALFIQLFHY
jgi:WD40 repeat protein